MHHYQKPNLVDTYIEVASNDTFLREMKEAAGHDGVHVTNVSRALPIDGDEASIGKSKFFMVFTGNVEDGSTGKPNADQQAILQEWGARVYPDHESWDISKKVATNRADGVEPRYSGNLTQTASFIPD